MPRYRNTNIGAQTPSRLSGRNRQQRAQQAGGTFSAQGGRGGMRLTPPERQAIVNSIELAQETAANLSRLVV